MGTETMRFLVVWMAGWISCCQLEVIDYLREENRVLRSNSPGDGYGSPMTRGVALQSRARSACAASA